MKKRAHKRHPFTFAPVPLAIMDDWLHRMSPTAFMVYCCIAQKTLAYHKDTEQISISWFARKTGFSRRTIDRALAELRKLSLIESTGTTKRASFYTIFYHRRLEIRSDTDDATGAQIANSVASRMSLPVASNMSHRIETNRKRSSSALP